MKTNLANFLCLGWLHKQHSSGKAANRYKGAIFIGEVLIVFDESAF
jgi:hypothetical protein